MIEPFAVTAIPPSPLSDAAEAPPTPGESPSFHETLRSAVEARGEPSKSAEPASAPNGSTQPSAVEPATEEPATAEHAGQTGETADPAAEGQAAPPGTPDPSDGPSPDAAGPAQRTSPAGPTAAAVAQLSTTNVPRATVVSAHGDLTGPADEAAEQIQAEDGEVAEAGRDASASSRRTDRPNLRSRPAEPALHRDDHAGQPSSADPSEDDAPLLLRAITAPDEPPARAEPAQRTDQPAPAMPSADTPSPAPAAAPAPLPLPGQNTAARTAAPIAQRGTPSIVPTTPAAPGASLHTESPRMSSPALRAMLTPTSAAAEPQDGMDAQALRGLTAAIRQGGGSVTLRLQPESLGDLRVRVDFGEGRVGATFQVESEQARQLLEQSLSHLRSALEARGLEVGRLDVRVAERPTDAAPQNADDPGSGGADPRGGAGDRGGEPSGRERPDEGFSARSGRERTLAPGSRDEGPVLHGAHAGPVRIETGGGPVITVRLDAVA